MVQLCKKDEQTSAESRHHRSMPFGHQVLRAGKGGGKKIESGGREREPGLTLLGQSLFWAKTNAGGSDWAAVHLLFSFSLFAFRRTEQKQNRNNQLNLAPAESPVADKLSH